jgi:Calx-beta domain/Fibronectin type III domain
MSLHRAVIFSIAVLFVYGSMRPDLATAASTTGAITIAGGNYGVVQNGGQKGIPVLRINGSSGAATVICKTANSTAVAGAQYTAVNTTLKWASGDDAPKVCSVPLLDATPFAGSLNFVVEISAATGAALGTRTSSTVTIYGNKGGGAVSISASKYSVAQNAGSVTITVNRTGGAAGNAVVSYATANSTAIAGVNYTAESGQLAWANEDAAPKSFTIPISNATPFTGSKTFAVAIAGALNANLGASTSTIVTIVGDAAATGQATLSWTAPTLDTDGTPLTNLAGYKIYYGTSQTQMTNVIQVSNPATLEYEISNLAKGTWYFSVAAYNTADVESSLSPTESKTI